MTVNGDTYMIMLKKMQIIPTIIDLEAYVWKHSNVTTTTAAMKTASTIKTIMIFFYI